MTVKKTPTNWRVVWWVQPWDVNNTHYYLRRCVVGRCEAGRAWRIFWRLRGQAHIMQGPELWRGRKRVL